MNNAGFCRLCGVFRARAVAVGVGNIELWQACEKCAVRPSRWSRKRVLRCGLHSLRSYRVGLARRRSASRAAAAFDEALWRAVGEVFGGGGGAL